MSKVENLLWSFLLFMGAIAIVLFFVTIGINGDDPHSRTDEENSAIENLRSKQNQYD